MVLPLSRPNGDSHDPAREPALAADWYLERRDHQNLHVDVLRPFFQGDVFISVPLDGVPFTDVRGPATDAGTHALDSAVMLIGHPCSMVAGAALLPFQEVVRVRPTKHIHYEQYGRTRFEEFFLPFVDPYQGDTHYSACLHERALVDTSRLDRTNRVAALSLDGVLALQQRITHESSRVRPKLSLICEATWPRWQETSLSQEWNDRCLAKLDLTGDELVAALAEEAAAFDKVLSAGLKYQNQTNGYTWKSTLREEMFDPANQGSVKVAVTVHAKARSAELAKRRHQEAQATARAAREAEKATPAPDEPAPPDSEIATGQGSGPRSPAGGPATPDAPPGTGTPTGG